MPAIRHLCYLLVSLGTVHWGCLVTCAEPWHLLANRQEAENDLPARWSSGAASTQQATRSGPTETAHSSFDARRRALAIAAAPTVSLAFTATVASTPALSNGDSRLEYVIALLQNATLASAALVSVAAKLVRVPVTVAPGGFLSACSDADTEAAVRLASYRARLATGVGLTAADVTVACLAQQQQQQQEQQQLVQEQPQQRLAQQRQLPQVSPAHRPSCDPRDAALVLHTTLRLPPTADEVAVQAAAVAALSDGSDSGGGGADATATPLRGLYGICVPSPPYMPPAIAVLDVVLNAMPDPAALYDDRGGGGEGGIGGAGGAGPSGAAMNGDTTGDGTTAKGTSTKVTGAAAAASTAAGPSTTTAATSAASMAAAVFLAAALAADLQLAMATGVRVPLEQVQLPSSSLVVGPPLPSAAAATATAKAAAITLDTTAATAATTAAAATEATPAVAPDDALAAAGSSEEGLGRWRAGPVAAAAAAVVSVSLGCFLAAVTAALFVSYFWRCCLSGGGGGGGDTRRRRHDPAQQPDDGGAERSVRFHCAESTGRKEEGEPTSQGAQAGAGALLEEEEETVLRKSAASMERQQLQQQPAMAITVTATATATATAAATLSVDASGGAGGCELTVARSSQPLGVSGAPTTQPGSDGGSGGGSGGGSAGRPGGGSAAGAPSSSASPSGPWNGYGFVEAANSPRVVAVAGLPPPSALSPPSPSSPPATAAGAAATASRQPQALSLPLPPLPALTAWPSLAPAGRGPSHVHQQPHRHHHLHNHHHHHHHHQQQQALMKWAALRRLMDESRSTAAAAADGAAAGQPASLGAATAAAAAAAPPSPPSPSSPAAVYPTPPPPGPPTAAVGAWTAPAPAMGSDRMHDLEMPYDDDGTTPRPDNQSAGTAGVFLAGRRRRVSADAVGASGSGGYGDGASAGGGGGLLSRVFSRKSRPGVSPAPAAAAAAVSEERCRIPRMPRSRSRNTYDGDEATATAIAGGGGGNAPAAGKCVGHLPSSFSSAATVSAASASLPLPDDPRRRQQQRRRRQDGPSRELVVAFGGGRRGDIDMSHNHKGIHKLEYDDGGDDDDEEGSDDGEEGEEEEEEEEGEEEDGGPTHGSVYPGGAASPARLPYPGVSPAVSVWGVTPPCLSARSLQRRLDDYRSLVQDESGRQVLVFEKRRAPGRVRYSDAGGGWRRGSGGGGPAASAARAGAKGGGGGSTAFGAPLGSPLGSMRKRSTIAGFFRGGSGRAGVGVVMPHSPPVAAPAGPVPGAAAPPPPRSPRSFTRQPLLSLDGSEFSVGFASGVSTAAPMVRSALLPGPPAAAMMVAAAGWPEPTLGSQLQAALGFAGGGDADVQMEEAPRLYGNLLASPLSFRALGGGGGGGAAAAVRLRASSSRGISVNAIGAGAATAAGSTGPASAAAAPSSGGGTVTPRSVGRRTSELIAIDFEEALECGGGGGGSSDDGAPPPPPVEARPGIPRRAGGGGGEEPFAPVSGSGGAAAARRSVSVSGVPTVAALHAREGLMPPPLPLLPPAVPGLRGRLTAAGSMGGSGRSPLSRCNQGFVEEADGAAGGGPAAATAADDDAEAAQRIKAVRDASQRCFAAATTGAMTETNLPATAAAAAAAAAVEAAGTTYEAAGALAAGRDCSFNLPSGGGGGNTRCGGQLIPSPATLATAATAADDVRTARQVWSFVGGNGSGDSAAGPDVPDARGFLGTRSRASTVAAPSPAEVLQAWSRTAAAAASGEGANVYGNEVTEAANANAGAGGDPGLSRPPSRWALRKAAAMAAAADSLSLNRRAPLQCRVASASAADDDVVISSASAAPVHVLGSRVEGQQAAVAAAVAATAAAAAIRPVTPEQRQLRQLQEQLRRLRSARHPVPGPAVPPSLASRWTGDGSDGVADGRDGDGGGDDGGEGLLGRDVGSGADHAADPPVRVWRRTVTRVLNEAAGVALDGRE